MERVARLIGIGLVVVGFCYAVVSYQRTMATAAPTSEAIYRLPIEQEVPDEPPLSAPMDESGLPPRYLAFTDELESGLYQVADAPGSRDRDVKPDRPAETAYPVETDLIPHHSLHSPGSLLPGLYATSFEVKGCGYELQRVNRSGQYSIIGSDRANEGRMLVSLNEVEPDVFHPTPQCGVWSPWSPLAEPLVVAGNGDYWIGDLAAGTWLVPTGCQWENVVAFRGAELVDVVGSGVGPDPLIVDDSTLGVRIRGCNQPLILDDGSAAEAVDLDTGSARGGT